MTVNEHRTLAARSFEHHQIDCDRCSATCDHQIKRDSRRQIKRLRLIQCLEFGLQRRRQIYSASPDYRNPCPRSLLHLFYLHVYTRTRSHTSATRRPPPTVIIPPEHQEPSWVCSPLWLLADV